MRNIRIAIADDHKLVRQTLGRCLSEKSHLSIIFDAKDGKDLLEKLSVEQPDVLLLDLRMPNLDGKGALGIVNRDYPGVRVLIMSSLMDEPSVLFCLEHNINGFLTKDLELSELVKAIELANENEVYVNNLLSNASLKMYMNKFRKGVHPDIPTFSEEEVELLNLLKLEKTTEEIAELMCLSKRSIEIKRDKMRAKANVKTIGGLLLYAVRRGIID